MRPRHALKVSHNVNDAAKTSVYDCEQIPYRRLLHWRQSVALAERQSMLSTKVVYGHRNKRLSESLCGIANYPRD